jgi:hypothetical protein
LRPKRHHGEAPHKAFDATLKDSAFLADAQKQRLELRAMNGGELADLVRTVIETPVDGRNRVKAAIQPKNAQTLPGARPGRIEDAR